MVAPPPKLNPPAAGVVLAAAPNEKLGAGAAVVLGVPKLNPLLAPPPEAPPPKLKDIFKLR